MQEKVPTSMCTPWELTHEIDFSRHEDNLPSHRGRRLLGSADCLLRGFQLQTLSEWSGGPRWVAVLINGGVNEWRRGSTTRARNALCLRSSKTTQMTRPHSKKRWNPTTGDQRPWPWLVSLGLLCSEFVIYETTALLYRTCTNGLSAFGIQNG